MQNIVSQIPYLSEFLKSVPKKHHQTTIKELIMIGLNVVKSSMSTNLSQHHCNCQKQNDNQQNKASMVQIERIKKNIEQLNQIVRNSKFAYNQFSEQRSPCRDHTNSQNKQQREDNQNQSSGYFGLKNSKKTDEINNIMSDSLTKHFSYQPVKKPVIRAQIPVQSRPEITPKITQTIPSIQGYQWNRRKCYSKHHLDDTQSKAVLEYPQQYQQNKNRQKERKSQEMRKHQYQEEINKEEINKLKNQPFKGVEEQNTHNRNSRKKAKSFYPQSSAISQNEQFKKTKSKIKSLVERDRLRHQKKVHEQQFKEGYNKYEYSDQNQMNEQNLSEEDSETNNNAQTHYHQENTYDEKYHGSSQRMSNKHSSKNISQQKPKQQMISIKKDASRQQSAYSNNHFNRSPQNQDTYSKKNQQNISYQDQDQDENDVISNSSSFSQFSINGSQRREIGKISRKRNQQSH